MKELQHYIQKKIGALIDDKAQYAQIGSLIQSTKKGASGNKPECLSKDNDG